MALSINWLTKVIFVPQSYVVLVTGELYEMDLNQFRLDLKDIEDNEAGMVFEDTHRHNTEITLAGVVYARSVEIINGYKVEFEDGHYTVRLYGANNNISDVKVLNSVSLISQNSAGLQTVNIAGGAAPSAAEVAAAVWAHSTAITLNDRVALAAKVLRNKQITDPATGRFTVYDDDGVSILVEGNLYEDAAGVQPYRGQGAERRERLA